MCALIVTKNDSLKSHRLYWLSTEVGGKRGVELTLRQTHNFSQWYNTAARAVIITHRLKLSSSAQRERHYTPRIPLRNS